MKFPSPSALPPLDKSTRLPVALALLLAAALAYQLAATDDVELPEAGPVAAASGNGPTVSGAGFIRSAVRLPSRALFFAPQQVAGPNGAAVQGVVIAGSMRTPRGLFAVVPSPNGSVRLVPVGGHVGEWRLVAIGESGAVLSRNAERLNVPFGTNTGASPVGAMGSQ